MSANSLKVIGINHVVLHVTDVAKSKEFYMGLLGFEERTTSGGGRGGMAFLRCGMQGLDLFQREGDVHGGEEMNHMAVNVVAEDLDEVMDALAAANIPTSERTARNSVFIHDPDGHQIEMLPLTANERSHEREAAQAVS